MDIRKIIKEAAQPGISDIHVVCGLPVRVRRNGEITDFGEEVLTHEDCEEIAVQLAGEEKRNFNGELDFALTAEGIRVRVNLFRQQGHASAAIRILSDSIPVLENLGLPEAVKQFPSYGRGIILVTGETGSGKSTTLAALLNEVNHRDRKHIITLEDPIEYVYTPDRCTINQREVGRDTENYASGMRAILREDPDVILIGEMRDNETIETALTAAETGHLVLATLHTGSAADSVDRIVSVFPGEKQQQIRMQLSMTLKAVLTQQLLKRADGKGRILACEVMVVNSAIRNLIREGKTPQINNAVQTSAQEGGILMDMYLQKLLQAGMITGETAEEAANDPEQFRPKQRPTGQRPAAQGRMFR